MNKKKLKAIWKQYFYRENFSDWRPYFIADCTAWDELYEKLFGEE